jgi:hypothetical protein
MKAEKMSHSMRPFHKGRDAGLQRRSVGNGGTDPEQYFENQPAEHIEFRQFVPVRALVLLLGLHGRRSLALGSYSECPFSFVLWAINGQKENSVLPSRSTLKSGRKSTDGFGQARAKCGFPGI